MNLLTAAELAADVRARKITAVEATKAALRRVESQDPKLGAFQLVRAERALVDAAAFDARADLNSLPLPGVPIAIKDSIEVAGEPIRVGLNDGDSQKVT